MAYTVTTFVTVNDNPDLYSFRAYGLYNSLEAAQNAAESKAADKAFLLRQRKDVNDVVVTHDSDLNPIVSYAFVHGDPLIPNLTRRITFLVTDIAVRKEEVENLSELSRN